MVRIIIDLENRTEHELYYGKWVACQRANKIRKCKDVEHVDVVDEETGEVYFTAEHGAVTWYEGLDI